MNELDDFWPLPAESEVAPLAFQFYLDSNCREGHERENWLCAQYMLSQKQMIESKIAAMHSRQMQAAA
jgi:hypothetical protein